jgi:hypothetical protein
MSTKAKRHTHKYYKVSIAGQNVWACALPDCNHYMPKHMDSLVPGKASICWSCSGPMILDPLNMENNNPICDDCSGRASIISKINEQLSTNK